MNKKELLEKINKNFPDEDKIDGFVLAVSSHTNDNLRAFTQFYAYIDSYKDFNINGLILTRVFHILIDKMEKLNEEDIFKLMEEMEIPPEILTLYEKMTERTLGYKRKDKKVYIVVDNGFIQGVYSKKEVAQKRVLEGFGGQAVEYWVDDNL